MQRRGGSVVSAAKAHAILQRAQQKCAQAGVRLTDKRQKILELLIEAGGPISAYDLVHDYNKRHEGDIKPMSVYRILDFLVSENLVHKLDLANQYIACEHIRCEHEHRGSHFLICRECQKAKEVNLSAELLALLTSQIKDAGFQLRSSQLEMDCLCESCAAKNA